MAASSATYAGRWSLVTDHLISEFSTLAPGRVIAAVALCRHSLVAAGLRGDGLTLATESMARAMLSRKA